VPSDSIRFIDPPDAPAAKRVARKVEAMSAKRPLGWKWIAIGGMVVALFVAWRLLPIGQWIGAFQGWAKTLGVLGGVLFGIAYVIAALLFVPGSLLTIGAGFTFGLLWGTVIVSASSVTAAALGFLIARYAARDQVERLVQRNRNFQAIDRAIAEKGWKVVVLLRLSPLVPFSVSNYLYGLTGIRFHQFVLASWVGMLPGTILYVYLGAAGQSIGKARERSVWEWVLLGAGLIATLAVTLLLTRVAKNELQKSGVENGRR
jgi:uncharacterized membrane protein YdjX (TVP38/TMEM64 family)